MIHVLDAVFMAVKVQVAVFWVVTPYRWRQQGPPKHWYLGCLFWL